MTKNVIRASISLLGGYPIGIYRVFHQVFVVGQEVFGQWEMMDSADFSVGTSSQLSFAFFYDLEAYVQAYFFEFEGLL